MVVKQGVPIAVIANPAHQVLRSFSIVPTGNMIRTTAVVMDGINRKGFIMIKDVICSIVIAIVFGIGIVDVCNGYYPTGAVCLAGSSLLYMITNHHKN